MLCVSANVYRAAADVRSWNKVPTCIVSSCREKTDGSSLVHYFSWLLYHCSWRSRHALQALFRPHLRKPLIAGWLWKEFFYLSPDHSFFADTPPNGGAITTGPDGALCFTQGWGPLGRIPMQGHITLFSPHYSGGPGRIVAGPDGALWMTEVDPHAGLIGRFSPSSARVPESRNVSAATFPCPVVTPIPTAPSTPSPPGS